MIITEMITMSNQRRYISPKIMFDFLFHEYHRRVCEAKEPIYDRYNKNLLNEYSNIGSIPYEIFKAITMSQLLMDFIEWKPYVKSINVEKVKKFLDKKLKLDWYVNYYNSSRHKIDGHFNSKDIEISILFFLHKKGMYFERGGHIPKSLYKLSTLFLYGKFMLNKLFEEDFREGKMKIFSNKTASERSKEYYSYEYRRRYYGYSDYASYDTIRFNYREYSNAITANEIDSSNHSFQIYNSTGGSVTDPTVVHNEYGNIIQVDTSGDSTIWTTLAV